MEPSSWRRELLLVIGLFIFGVWIWMRDLAWLASAGDTLPILLGLPLFAWLGRPWKRSQATQSFSPRTLGIAASLLLIGIVLDSTLALALSWTVFFWSWISSRFVLANVSILRLLVLPVLAFPWIQLDLDRVGWWFRLSGTAAASNLLALAPLDVAHHGTFLFVNQFSVSVEPACSGLNGLQALLLAGAVIAHAKLKSSAWYWYAFPILACAAWISNVLRIALAAIAGLLLQELGMLAWFDGVHQFLGIIALGTMLWLSWTVFNWMANSSDRRSAERTLGALQRHWLDLALIIYCAWHCRDIASAWFSNPFDRFGWLAFGIWTLPLVVSWGNDSSKPGSTASTFLRRKISLQWIGLIITFGGDVGDFNFAKQIGSAVLLASFATGNRKLFWNLGALSWISGAGWLCSRLGLGAGIVALLRVTIASSSCLWMISGFYWRAQIQQVNARTVSNDAILRTKQHASIASDH